MEVLQKFDMMPGELMQILTVLAGFKLAKDVQIGGELYYVLWDYQG
jgi:hypothetical protein